MQELFESAASRKRRGWQMRQLQGLHQQQSNQAVLELQQQARPVRPLPEAVDRQGQEAEAQREVSATFGDIRRGREVLSPPSFQGI
ncbi:MAG TPA: hypothetical protein V6D17_11375 [Candidatus Obscuribacterales bacterium]